VNLGNIARSGELDVGMVIKTKNNAVALRTAKNKHYNCVPNIRRQDYGKFIY
jgi:hypothetical protein